MFTVTKYPHGTFSWADCNTNDVDKARPFYTALMGWTVEELPMGEGLMYSFLKLDGQTATAISPMFPGADGVPSHWNTYVSVDDVDAMVEKVEAAGGTVLAPPMDIFENGRMMPIQDPTGAHIGLWQPKAHIGAYVVNKPGAMVWNELATRDVPKAKAFYESVLGWNIEQGPWPFYFYIRNNGRMIGGIIAMDEQWGDIPPHWQVYFAVADIEAIAKRVPELGGQILSGIDESSVGRFAVISDPSGAMFATIQMKELTPWVE